MSTAIAIVVVLLGLVAFLYYTNLVPLKNEGFAILVKTCPTGTTSYITHAGDTNCCSGEVINNQCENVMCSLSPGPNNCSSVLKNQFKERSAAKCHSSISGDCSNYFTNVEGTVKGCSKSNPNAANTGPSDLSQPYCRLYNNLEANTKNYDSCQNYLARYNALNNLNTCNSSLVKYKSKYGVL